MLSNNPNVTAIWDVHLPDGIHEIEFEHETTSGRRVIRIDNQEILRKDWMFKLVGTEVFSIGKDKQHKCVIDIRAVSKICTEKIFYLRICKVLIETSFFYVHQQMDYLDQSLFCTHF